MPQYIDPKSPEDFKALQVLANMGGEHNDCGVKALAVACDVEYATALRLLRILGREARKGTCFTFIRQAVHHLGKSMVGCPTDGKYSMQHYDAQYGVPYTARTMRTIAIDPWFATGRFLVLTAGGRHIAAVRDGKVIDWTAGSASRIYAVWKVC